MDTVLYGKEVFKVLYVDYSDFMVLYFNNF